MAEKGIFLTDIDVEPQMQVSFYGHSVDILNVKKAIEG